MLQGMLPLTPSQGLPRIHPSHSCSEEAHECNLKLHHHMPRRKMNNAQNTHYPPQVKHQVNQSNGNAIVKVYIVISPNLLVLESPKYYINIIIQLLVHQTAWSRMHTKLNNISHSHISKPFSAWESQVLHKYQSSNHQLLTNKTTDIYLRIPTLLSPQKDKIREIKKKSYPHQLSHLVKEDRKEKRN